MDQTETLTVLAWMVAINVIGTLSIASAAKGNDPTHLVIGAAFYVVGAVLFRQLMRHGGDVGVWGPISSIAGLILVTGFGHIFWAEVMTSLRAVGLVLAAFAILLIALGSETGT